MITKFGKRFLVDFIAGNSNFNSKDLAIGIATESQMSESDTNTRLGFEIYRMPVNLSSINIESDGAGGFNYYTIFKTTIPQDISGVIRHLKTIFYGKTLTEIAQGLNQIQATAPRLFLK